MNFLKQKNPSYWQNLEDKQIDKIISDIEHFPDLANISYQLSEFQNALRFLKKNISMDKRVRLIENIHSRSAGLSNLMDNLNSSLKTTMNDEEKLNSISDSLKQKLLKVMVKIGQRESEFYVDKEKDFIIGKANLPYLPRSLSEALFSVDFHRSSRILFKFLGHCNCTIYPANEERGIVAKEGLTNMFQIKISDNVRILTEEGNSVYIKFEELN